MIIIINTQTQNVKKLNSKPKLHIIIGISEKNWNHKLNWYILVFGLVLESSLVIYLLLV